MNLYFSDKICTLTTFMLLILLCYIFFLFWKRNSIQKWGRHILLLDAFGLYICCYAATRDGLHLTIQNAIDGSTAPGIFALLSVPVLVSTVGALLIVLSGIISIFVKKQRVLRVLCYINISGILLKIVTIEISRILIH